MTLITETTPNTQILMELWETTDGVWDFATVTPLLIANDAFVDQAEFDTFTAQINDGLRCVNDAKETDSMLTGHLCIDCWYEVTQ